MKNGKLVALLTGVLLVLAGTVYTIKHLRDQEQQAEATYGTEMPRVADIILKTIASGSVQPRQEILIKRTSKSQPIRDLLGRIQMKIGSRLIPWEK